jgi:hypothetical protein
VVHSDNGHAAGLNNLAGAKWCCLTDHHEELTKRTRRSSFPRPAAPDHESRSLLAILFDETPDRFSMPATASQSQAHSLRMCVRST